MNNVVLVGNLVRDPEKRNTSGDSCCTFTVACNRDFKNSQGQYEADFIQCVAWREKADFVLRYFRKGRKIGVKGRIQTRTFEAQDGTKRYVTELAVDHVEFVDSAPGGAQSGKAEESKPVTDRKSGFKEVEDDDLPF